MKSLKLNVGDFGDDVAQLHEILKQQGIEVAVEEVKRQFFGPATREAVQNFQRQQGLNDSGELNLETAALLKPNELRGSISARKTIPLSRREELTTTTTPSDADDTHRVAKRPSDTRSENPVAVPMQRVALSKTQLLELESLSDRTPSELKASNPALYARLKTQATDAAKETLDTFFRDSSPTLRERTANIDPARLIEQGQDIRSALLETLVDTEISPELLREAEERIQELERDSSPLNVLELDVPLKTHPLVQGELQQAKLHRIGDVAGLSEAKVTAVLARSPSVFALDDEVLQSAVDAGELDTTEAKQLGLTASLYQLVDENIGLVETLERSQMPQLGQRPVQALQDLVSLDAQDWVSVMQTAEVTPPQELTVEAYGEVLSQRIAQLYPSDALLSRLKPLDEATIAADLEQLQPLVGQNPTLLKTAEFEEVDTQGISVPEPSALKLAFTELKQFTNTFPGLELAEVLDDPNLMPAAKAQQVSERVGWLTKVKELNPEMELINLDYTPESEDVVNLKLDGIPEAAKPMVLRNLKANQRVHALTKNADHSRSLLGAGLDSALKVAQGSLETFIEKTGLPANIAYRYYGSAQNQVSSITIGMGAIMDYFYGGFNWLAVGNMRSDIEDYLKKFDGYEELFGSQAYCRCEHCQSILSPAAYFVDLMYFIEEKVLEPTFIKTKKEDHPLNLKVRRPDLWTLELTCENTHELVPTLDIINEILENYLYMKGLLFKEEDLPDRTAVETFVYRALSHSKDSFQQPALLPLKKLEIYLQHFDISRGHVARVIGKSSEIQARATLGLSKQEWNLITEADVTQGFLKPLYDGVLLNTSGDPDEIIEPFDVQDLLKPMGLSRQELGTLIQTWFVKQGSAMIRIQAEKQDDEKSVQNDIERIYGLNQNALDRMHRFTRLWRKLDWEIDELDLVLNHLKDENLTQLEDLASIIISQQRLGISVEQVCALWSELPQKTLADNRHSLLHRLFNLPPFEQPDEHLPQPKTLFVHPSFRKESSNGKKNPDESYLYRLRAGLNVSDEELSSLISHLHSHFKEDESDEKSVDTDKPRTLENGFKLGVHNLTLLYRHALLAKRLKLSIAELFQLIQLAGISKKHIQTLAQFITLLDFYQVYQGWKSAGYSLDDLSYITGGNVKKLETYPNEKNLADKVLSALKTQKPFEFVETVFAFLEGVTEDQSRQILKDNKTLIPEILSTKPIRRLASTFSPTKPLTIEPAIIAEVAKTRGIAEAQGKTLLENETLVALLKYHVSEIIPNLLATQLEISVEKTKALIAMIGIDLGTFQDDLAAYQTDKLSKDKLSALKANLSDRVAQLLPLKVLFSKTVFDADSLRFIQQNKTIFGINDFTKLTIEQVRKLLIYGAVADTEEAAKYSSEEPAFEPKDVQNSLLALHQGKLTDEKQSTLAKVLRVEKSVVASLLSTLDLPTTAPEALERLLECAELATYLGVGGETLVQIVPDDDIVPEDDKDEFAFTQLALASNAILGAFRAKYSDEKVWQEKIAPFEDRIRSCKRDILTDYLIHSIDPQFQSLSDLYHYFLMDVELTGCARTSRVVAATSSLQLYIHRILMNLEQDRRESGDAKHIHVSPERIPTEEWAWRKNYRVWEANRKVFLYPENYIEPELRDNKTPLFEELESTLLQQEVNEQNVLDAYTSYMRGFEEVAKLKIAGAFHDKGSDILHLFGVTSDEPPIYYYRTVKNLHYGETEDDRGVVWEPWHKIEVQIPVKKVTPVVYQNRLYVFWVQITTLPKNDIVDGSSKFIGYKHTLSLQYTTLRLDNTWTAPQAITLPGGPPFNGAGVINDLLLEPHEEKRTLEVIQELISALEQNLNKVRLSTKYEETPYEKKKILEKILDDSSYLDLLFGEKYNTYKSRITQNLPSLYTPKYGLTKHFEPKDGYTLTGFLWDQVYPLLSLPWAHTGNPLGILIAGIDLKGVEVDFYRKSLVPSSSNSPWGTSNRRWTIFHATDKGEDENKRSLNMFVLDKEAASAEYFERSLMLDRNHLSHASKFSYYRNYPLLFDFKLPPDSFKKLFYIKEKDELSIVNANPNYGFLEECILDSNGDLLLIQGFRKSQIKRLGTSAHDIVLGKFYNNGINALLSINFQKNELKEKRLPIDNLNTKLAVNKSIIGKPDFVGPYGVYYREIFFHIPFLIANHLNSQSHFTPAQRWYHYIYNPTANEVTKPETDRNWRYLEFRGLGLPKLRKILTDKEAIDVYKDNPFSPHAIARLRLSAYQKSIVMKYIDNLLDWGDSLFSRFTMESVNEATLLYVMAADILGERPVELGECGEGKVTPKNYKNLRPFIQEDSPFLIEIENQSLAREDASKAKTDQEYTLGSLAHNTVESTNLASGVTSKPISKGSNGKIENQVGAYSQLPNYPLVPIEEYRMPSEFGKSILNQIGPAFCIPVNKELGEYWNRVEDRLFKIRHCMDIKGVRRQLELFAPEIDPRLLVRAKKMGLSIEDVLNATSGDLPPYRFTYLIEKAKQYVSTVQSFGSALLSALEKKDVEELNQLRTVHEQTIQRLTTKIKQWEIDAESETIAALEKQENAITYRRDYYQQLSDEGLIAEEHVEQIAQHTANLHYLVSSILSGVAALNHLFPQLGSPLTLEWGGKELGDSLRDFAEIFSSHARVNELVAKSAGIEANFKRREQGWEHSEKLASHELEEIEKKLEAARIRKQIVQRSQEIHKKNIAQTKEIFDLYKDKFSSLGLYTWLSSTLQRLYREAYNSAFAMARLAEQAYRFERGDDGEVLLDGNYWEASRAGLLAGERLLIDLQNMERRFIETNYRNFEIDQSFSLSQINPGALLQLRVDGKCNFNIPELFFDLFYPGQYRRRIKAVRITIPCVTGPYVNVSATLNLQGSELRNKPELGSDALKPVPLRRSISIATSKAQNDSGVFEFNFRDERYMPFEGAGAISSWQLRLPKNFRQFDYLTISDVILHINYTAEEDGTFREKVEGKNENLEGEILKALKDNHLSRIFSLKQDFPSEFHRLLNSPVDTPVTIEISDRHLPIFLKDPRIKKVLTKGKLVLVTAEQASVKGVEIEFNNKKVETESDDGKKTSVFSKDPKLGELYSQSLNTKEHFAPGILAKHTLKLKKAGDLKSNNMNGVDSKKLLDMMLYLEYKIELEK